MSESMLFPLAGEDATGLNFKQLCLSMAEKWVEEGFEVSAAEAYTVSISAGRAFLNGMKLYSDTALTYSFSSEGTYYVYLTYSTSPAQVLVDASTVFEDSSDKLYLAKVIVDASGNVTVRDRRKFRCCIPIKSVNDSDGLNVSSKWYYFPFAGEFRPKLVTVVAKVIPTSGSITRKFWLKVYKSDGVTVVGSDYEIVSDYSVVLLRANFSDETESGVFSTYLYFTDLNDNPATDFKIRQVVFYWER